MITEKSNKKALIIASLVILISLACLSGATLALFTNDIGDGTIGIITTAGDIEVDIVDTTAEENSLVGEYLKFHISPDLSSESKDILFEPGATYHTDGFKIKNTGDIPVSFRLFVSEDESIDMDEFNRAFEVWISKESIKNENAQRLTEFVGRLEVGKSTENTYFLFVKMKETAGNEFKNKTYSGIGVTVYAVQGNAVMDNYNT